MVSWDSRMLGLQKLSSPAWWSAVLTVTCLCKFLWPWPFWKLMGELETMCLCRRSTHLSCFFFLVLWSIFSSSFMSSLFCSSFLVFHLFSYSTFFCVFCLMMVDLVYFRLFLSCVCHFDIWIGSFIFFCHILLCILFGDGWSHVLQSVSVLCVSFGLAHLFTSSTFFCVFCLVMVDLVFFRVFLSCVCHLDWLWLQVVSADPPAEGKFNFCLALNMLCFMSRKQKVGLCKI